ncbi:MAG TPA: addiction module toxin RelE [Porphyromonadaceae bacterium]|nr:addiction module toxin RelE [Porphyromonadaceae bacterium]HBX20148.1 addiction module toxin RelE [Porphyromonadaceae bacterium]HCM22668.1 addiction module toxin RelE [Porphyromonadaceae bacterium]
MRIVAKKTFRDFWEKHSDSEQFVKSWFHDTGKAKWRSHNELKADYPNARILKSNRVVFNIKGNNYRLIIKINYDYQLIWIRFIGTHSEYDNIDANIV